MGSGSEDDLDRAVHLGRINIADATGRGCDGRLHCRLGSDFLGWLALASKDLL